MKMVNKWMIAAGSNNALAGLAPDASASSNYDTGTGTAGDDATMGKVYPQLTDGTAKGPQTLAGHGERA